MTKAQSEALIKSMEHYLAAWKLPVQVQKAVINYATYAVANPKHVDDQAWFWSKKWQQGERQADKDISLKKLSKKFTSSKEAIDFLNR